MNKTPIEEILKAGFGSTEDEALEFLLGLGVKTGTDLRYIDGYTTAETTFKLVGNVFMLKKICKKVKTAADDNRLDTTLDQVVSSLRDVDSYLQKLDTLETKFQENIGSNRKIQAGKTNVIQLRPQTDKTLKVRECGTPIRGLEEVRKKAFETREDVLEFLVGMGVQPVEGLRYINGYTARDTMRTLIGTLNQMKKECVRALTHIENTPSFLYPNEVAEMHSHIQSFLHGLKVEERSYFSRLDQSRLPAYGGNVIPFNR